MNRELIESGIGYLGKIPKSWNIYRIKNAFKCEKNIVGESWKNTQLLSLTTSGIKEKDIENPNGKLPESFDGYQYVRKNNLVMCLFDLDCSAVFSGISKYEGMISPAYKVLECNERMNPDFAGYYFNYISFDRKYMHYSKNIRYTLNYEEFSSLPMLFPSLEEQEKIADYLDKKCKKIDEIIKNNNKEIEFLEQLKENKIYEMLKEYPKVKIKYVISGIKDGTHGSFSRVADGEYLLSSKNLTEKGILIGDNESMISIEDYNSIVSNGYPQKGDIMFCSVGSVGKTCIYDYEKRYAFQRSVSFLRVNSLISNKLLLYNTKTRYFKEEVGSSINKALQDGLYMNQIKDLKIFLPPLEIQNKLCEKIESYVMNLDKVIEYRKQIIEKLEEYKRSLIYECVTGKKEVN